MPPAPQPRQWLPDLAANIVSFAVHPQRGHIASGDRRGGLTLWQCAGEHCTPVNTWTGHRAAISALCWQDNTLISGSRGGAVVWWQDGTAIRQLAAGRSTVNALQWCARRRQLFAVTDDGALHRWQDSPEQHDSWTVHQGRATCVALHPDGRIFTASSDANVLCWDLDEEAVWTWNGHVHTVTALAVSPDGRFLASASQDGALKIWDAHTGTIVSSTHQHEGAIHALTWTEEHLVTGGADFRLGVWHTKDGALRLHGWLQQHQRPVHALAAVGAHVLSAGADRTMGLWRPSDAHPTAIHHAGSVRALAFSPDGTELASGSRDESVWVRRAADGGRRRRLVGHRGAVQGVAFSPCDAGTLLSVATDGQARLWQTADGSLLTTVQAHEQPISACTWSTDGQFFFTGSRDHRIRIWSSSDHTLRGELCGHAHWVRALCMHPDGQRLISGSYDGTTLVWDWRREQLLKEGANHIDAQGKPVPVTGLAVPADNHVLISGGLDGCLRVSCLRTGDTIHSTMAHEDAIVAVTAHALGVLSAGMDHRVCLWHWDGEQLHRQHTISFSAPLDSLSTHRGTVAVGDRRGHTWLLAASTALTEGT